MGSGKTLRALRKIGGLLDRGGYIIGCGGNISARDGDTVYIKRKGIAMGESAASGYVGIRLSTGKALRGSGEPSTEIYMHLACYKKRPDIGAVIHTHPPFATAFATSGRRLGDLSYELLVTVNSRIARIGYVKPGTRALGKAIGRAAGHSNAILLKNHGLLTVGKDLNEAYLRTLAVERACITYLCCRFLGKISRLPPGEAKRWIKVK